MNRRVFRNSLVPSNMDASLRNTFPIYQPEYTCCKYLVNTKQTGLDETVLLSIQEIMLKLVGKKFTNIVFVIYTYLYTWFGVK